jgi:hypothetical protein
MSRCNQCVHEPEWEQREDYLMGIIPCGYCGETGQEIDVDGPAFRNDDGEDITDCPSFQSRFKSADLRKPSMGVDELD